MLASLRAFRRLNRDVAFFIGVTGILGMTVLGGVFAVLFNLFILRLGFGPEFVGQVNAVGLLGFALPALPAGWLSARWGARPTMMLGLVVTALGYGLLALCDLLPAELRAGWLLTTNVIGAVGSAIYLVNTGPFLASVTRPDERAHALSAQVAVWPLTGFVGSLLGGAMPGMFAQLLGVAPEDPAAYRYPLLLASLAVLPALALLQAAHGGGRVSTESKVTHGPAPIRLIALVTLAVMLQVGCEGVATTFFNVYLDEQLGVATAEIGVLLAVARLASVPAALLTPTLTGRWGVRRTFVGASLGIALFAVPLALIPHWLAASASMLALGCASAIARSTVTTFQMDAVGPAYRGIISASVTAGFGVSWAALAYGGGYTIAHFGYPAVFLGGAALTVIGALIFGLFVRPPQPAAAPPVS